MDTGRGSLAPETEAEMMQRWNENPRRIWRWIGNHQEDILRKYAENEPQNLLKRLTPKRTKNLRSKNARDMAKAHHPDLKAKWIDLHQQFKDGKMSKSEMLAEYNKAKPSVSALTKTNAYSVLTLPDLQIVQYVPPFSVSTATEANTTRVQHSEPEAYWEHDRRGEFVDSDLGIQQGDSNPGESALIPPHPQPGPAPRDDAEAMLIDSICPEPPAPDGVLSRAIIASPDRVPQPTSYTMQQAPFYNASLESIGMDVDTSHSCFVSHINEWPAHYVTTPRAVEAFQLHQRFSDFTNRHAYIDTSSSMVHPLDTQSNLPTPPSYVQPSAYNALLLPQVTHDSQSDQNRPPHTIESHNSSSTDSRSTSSKAAVAAHDRFKDWSPAGDWHLQKVFRGHTDFVWCHAFSHNGKLLASVSDDCTVRVWNVETGETVLGPLKGHTTSVDCLALSPDDLRIASGTGDFTVCIWDVQTGEQLLEVKEHTTPVMSVALSSDGSRVASCDGNDDILIWDVDSKRRVRWLESRGYGSYNLYFSADDRFIAASFLDEFSIWDTKSGQLMSTSPQAGSFGDLIWFGECALYGCMDGRIHRWSEKETFRLGWRSALPPERKWIAASFCDNIYLYSRDLSLEELGSVGDIKSECRRFTLVEDELSEDFDSDSEYDA